MFIPSTRCSACLSLVLVVGMGMSTLASQGAREAVPSIRVTFLGTGSPAVSIDRFSACILIEAGPRRLLFDAGRGCLFRLQQAGVDLPSLTSLFITHLHSDHVLSVPDLILTGWTQGRKGPLDVYGPTGTKDMITHLVAAYQVDINARVRNGRLLPQVTVNEVSPGVILNQDGVLVRAFEVDHGDVAPAFGYRVDAGGRGVVLSGDTRPSEGLIRAAEGADVLIHEVALGPANPTPQQQYVLGDHTFPEGAAEVFRRVKPRLAVYSHIILQAGATEEEVIARTRASYAGRLEVANDLTVVEIGREITVRRPR